MNFFDKYGNLIGRILISAIFLFAGVNKLYNYSETEGYMLTMGVPSIFLPLAIALEIVGSVAIIVGFKTKIFSFSLAGFSLISAFIFHMNFADQIQSALFMKNMAIAGGFLFLMVNGAGMFSLDNNVSKEN